jgi:hypothetical protein
MNKLLDLIAKSKQQLMVKVKFFLWLDMWPFILNLSTRWSSHSNALLILPTESTGWVLVLLQTW